MVRIPAKNKYVDQFAAFFQCKNKIKYIIMNDGHILVKNDILLY